MQNIYIICIPEEIFRTAEYTLFHRKRKKKEILKESKVEPVE
jgi:hypothetical protein